MFELVDHSPPKRRKQERTELYILICTVLALAVETPPLTVPPELGALTESSVRVVARGGAVSAYGLRVLDDTDTQVFFEEQRAELENDLCMHWHVTGLQPENRYRYELTDPVAPKREPFAAEWFTTRSVAGPTTPATIAFASCAYEDEGSAGVWYELKRRNPDALVLLGDTPYIDRTDLSWQRKRYREFATFPSFAELAAVVPIYATWDDHDFGRNDTDGTMPKKENSRRAFLEYRPVGPVGQDNKGIYTRFRIGAIEVFLLDARWFAGTESSSFDESKKTLLGAEQWKWFKAALAESDAPFKIIATGMIFNGAVRPFKTDYWAHYPHELDALYALVGELSAEGVVLVGGDIHRHRIVRHGSKSAAGYDLVEFISSPVHHSIIASANAPHPGLLMDMGVGHMYLELEAVDLDKDPALVSRFIHSDGTVRDERRWPRSAMVVPKN